MNTITLMLISMEKVYTMVHGTCILITNLASTLKLDPRGDTLDSYSNTSSHTRIRLDTKIGQHHILEENLYMTMSAPLVFQTLLRQGERLRERSLEVRM